MRRRGKSYVIEVKLPSGEIAVITVDSAAEESVCPKGWAAEFKELAVEKGKELNLINASGGMIPHYGAKTVTFKAAVF